MHTLILLLVSVVAFHIGDQAGQEYIRLPKGLRAYSLSLDKKPGEDIRSEVMVNVIAEISEPIKTAVILSRVQVLVVDVDDAGKRNVTVVVTPTQARILRLLREDGAKLSVKLHAPNEQKKD